MTTVSVEATDHMILTSFSFDVGQGKSEFEVKNTSQSIEALAWAAHEECRGLDIRLDSVWVEGVKAIEFGLPLEAITPTSYDVDVECWECSSCGFNRCVVDEHDDCPICAEPVHDEPESTTRTMRRDVTMYHVSLPLIPDGATVKFVFSSDEDQTHRVIIMMQVRRA